MTDLVDLLAASRHNIDQLDDPEALRRVAQQVADLATARGATRLVAASPYGERIVGAAMLMYTQSLRGGMYAQTDENLTGQSVLVVDVNLASGMSMAHAARRARLSGAAHVDGAVVHAFGDAVGPAECGLDALDVLSE